MGIIYLARNKANGKGYVGQTTKSLKERKRCHVKDSLRRTTPFAKAIVKYGADGFDWYVLSIVDNNRLYAIEKQWTKALGTLSPSGYNLIDAGPGRSGYSLSDEAKARLSEFRTGRPMPDETKRKIANTLKNRVFSNEHRANLSASCKGRVMSQESIEKTRAAKIGKKMSAETRAKMSASKKGKRTGGPVTAESRAKISASKIGKKHGPYSPDHCAAISAGLLRFYSQQGT